MMEDVAGVIVDKCNSKAYYGAGTWWIDRWQTRTSENIATPAIKHGHGENEAMAVCSILSEHIVRTSQNTVSSGKSNEMLNNIICSGHLKRKLSGRSGRWWPSSGWSTSPTPSRRPWRSTRLARARLLKVAESCQMNMNDKFFGKSLHWAKDSFVPGAGRSNMPREEIREVDNNKSSSIINTNYSASMVKPGSSSTAVKDTPGKDNYIPVTNIVFQGQECAREGGQVCEGGLEGGHCQQGVTGHLLHGEVPQQMDGQGLAKGVPEVGGGEHGDHGHVRDGTLGGDHGQQGAAEHLSSGEVVAREQLLCVHGQGMAQDGPEGGGGMREQRPEGLVGEQHHPTYPRLKYPEDSASPKFVKSRRRKKSDGLVQAKLTFIAAKKHEIIPSFGDSVCPSGGPQGEIKSERGFKRGLGDQVEGPPNKKSRD